MKFVWEKSKLRGRFRHTVAFPNLDRQLDRRNKTQKSAICHNYILILITPQQAPQVISFIL